MYNRCMDNRISFTQPLGSRAGGLSYTVLIAVNLLISLIVQTILMGSGAYGTDGAKYVSYLVAPLAIGVTMLLALLLFKQPAKRLLSVKTRPKYYLIALLLIFGLLFSLNSANDYIVKLFELMGYKSQSSTLPDISGWKIVPAILVIAVLPAVMEEIMFRGILLNNLEEGVGTVRTVFLVGFCFSLYHGRLEQTVYQFICGCLFALLALRSRSILPSIIIHFLNNALIIVLYACGAVDAVTGELLISQTANIIISVFSALSLIGAVVWLSLDKQLKKPCAFHGVRDFFIFAAIGILAMAALWISNLVSGFTA